MNATTPEAPTQTNGPQLSKDGKWRSFPKVPNLLQYVKSKTYYARTKVRGKLIRRSLKTNVFTTAKLRLADFVQNKEEEHGKKEGTFPLFSQAVEAYKRAIELHPSMKSSSKEYRKTCIRKIELSWPELWKLHLNEITVEACEDWAAKVHKSIATQYYNNTIATLRGIIQAGIPLIEGSKSKFENPAKGLKRGRITQTHLQLPEPEQFRELVNTIRKESGGWGPKAADLVEFLSFSGLRLYTEAVWVTSEDIDWKRKEIVVRGNPETHTKNWEIRRIPIIPDMEDLLTRMGFGENGTETGKVLQISRCPESLKRACEKIGIPRLSHHDLRHLFATRCIESGVDIPTVARWLGHKDGGVLAMKTYGHLRNEHSQAMAAKVKF